MFIKYKQHFLLLVAIAPLWSHAQTCHVSVQNPSPYERQEVVEIPASRLQSRMGGTVPTSWIVNDSKGNEVASQVTHDGKLLFPVTLPARGASTLTVRTGHPQAYAPAVFVKMYPERVDDIAWENDRIAFRTYGPALQRSGERAFGFDVWVKNTPELVVDQRYNTELSPANKAHLDALRKTDRKQADDYARSISYHIDHGNGMDCYKVGPTLGCGTPALIDSDGAIVYPWCYERFEILDQGPLRLTFRMTYPVTNVPGVGNVTEIRTISLDQYTWLNRIHVSYRGADVATSVVAGIVVHKEDTLSYALMPHEGMMLYADPTDGPTQQNGQIFTACVFPQKVGKMELRRFSVTESRQQRNGDFGHLLTFPAKSKGEELGTTYYFGAAWSKYSIPTFDAWKAEMLQTADRLKHPLKVTIRK